MTERISELAALAQMHVRHCEDVVQRQERLVEDLRLSGRDTSQAGEMLDLARRALAERQADLASLLRGTG